MPRRTRIKICGVTTPQDALAAVEAGADAIGLNFHSASPRYIDPGAAVEIAAAVAPGVELVGVFVDRSIKQITQIVQRVALGVVQLHGSEAPFLVSELAPRRVLRSIAWKGPESCADVETLWQTFQMLGHYPGALLIDGFGRNAKGGTGTTWDWHQAAQFRFPAPIYLAGGLTPSNVREAVGTLKPFGVDVATGVEDSPGRKSAVKMAEFIAAVREADAAAAD